MKTYYYLIFVFLFPFKSFSQAPSNACNAGTLVTVGTCTGAQSGIGNNTDDGLAGGCAGTFSRDAWWSFTATATSTVITFTNTTANDNPAIFLYNGTCAAKNYLTCDNTTNSAGADTETLTYATTIGTTYLVQIKNFGSGTFDGELCLSSPIANDLVCNATSAICGGTYSGTTAGSTTTGETALPSCSSTAPSAAGVWYVYAGNGSVVTASLCAGTSYDSKINVYSGANCGSLTTCVASNDDGCGSASTVTFSTVTGTNYYILVNGYSSATGNYSLAITCCTPGVPSCATLNTPANAATGVTQCSSLTWTAPATSGCSSVDSYDVYFGTVNPPPFYGNTTSTSYPVTVSGSTVYYWQIRPKNSSGAASGCSVFSFTSAAAGNPQYTMVDDANSTSPYTCVNLTTTSNDQRGCAWDVNSTLNFTGNFSYDFTVNLGNSDAGADGMAFVMQNDPQGRCKCGTTGGALGAGGILNSVIVEIDTYINTEDRDDFSSGFIGCSGSEDPDHLDIWLGGNINPDTDFSCDATGAGERPATPSAVRLQNGGTNYNIENGTNHILRIAWNAGSSTLTASIMNMALSTTYGTISSTFNPMTVFGTNTPYFGFTASTGGLNNAQSFCNPGVLLPIELISFNTYCFENYRKVYWATASEHNNAYFTLEKSFDGIHFETLKIIPSEAMSSGITNYEYKDEDQNSRVVYYRLSQTDLNGVATTYDVISSDCSNKMNALTIETIFDNSKQLEIELNCITENEHNIQVVDHTGRIVLSDKLLPVKGMNKIEFAGKELKTGIYFLQVANANESVTKRFLIH